MNSKLRLTREQFATFLSDPKAIRDFERLFLVGERFEDAQYQDIDFPIIIRTTGPNIPVLTAFHGNILMPLWQVNDFNVCEAQEIAHGWKEGTSAEWHLHCTTNGLDAADRFLRFELEYGYVAVNGAWAWPAVITTADLLIPANTPDRTMLVFPLGNFTPANGVGGHAVARLKRVAAAGSAPTANPFIPMLQIHIQLDTLGSRTMSAK